ncbi:mitochondrial import receptor subunit TOM20 homolog [Brevipalpus obovatus]
MSRMAIGIAAGVAGSLFLAYCFYFDKKRRMDPNFKQKLRERRAASRKKMEERAATKFPDVRDPDALQSFFVQEITLGEELLSYGDLEGGVEHLTNAVAVCAQPQQLLQVLNQTMPPHVFELILNRLSKAGPTAKGPTMVEDDLE